jgi:hypothetical protein
LGEEDQQLSLPEDGMKLDQLNRWKEVSRFLRHLPSSSLYKCLKHVPKALEQDHSAEKLQVVDFVVTLVLYERDNVYNIKKHRLSKSMSKLNKTVELLIHCIRMGTRMDWKEKDKGF